MAALTFSETKRIPGSSVILHIDDDELSQELFRETFKSLYHVVSLGSTDNALDILEKYPVKVIVSDQRMANETGTEFFKRIQVQYPDVIRIILTAYSSKDSALQAINDGDVYRYLIKPWKREDVSEAIRSAIREFDLGQEKRSLLSELRQKNEELTIAYKRLETNEIRFVQTIIQTQEEEQSRYARELHDGLGPLLSTLKMHIQWLANPGNSENKEKIIHHAIHTVDHAIRSVKEMANNLSPHILQRFGLVNAVNAYIERVKESTEIQFTVTSNLRERLQTDTELFLYRTVLECINNSLKHSEAKKIIIRFTRNKNSFQINISDNGKGFDVKYELDHCKGMGLFNMQNRIRHIGGEFSIHSNAGTGTEININIGIN